MSKHSSRKAKPSHSETLGTWCAACPSTCCHASHPTDLARLEFSRWSGYLPALHKLLVGVEDHLLDLVQYSSGVVVPSLLVLLVLLVALSPKGRRLSSERSRRDPIGPLVILVDVGIAPVEELGIDVVTCQFTTYS